MASDLISLESLFDDMREEEWQGWHPLDEVDAVIAKAPAVDAVPVVRCKDCDFFWEYTAEYKAKVKKDGDCGFRYMNGVEDHFCMVTNDDYCSLARSKKDAVD